MNKYLKRTKFIEIHSIPFLPYSHNFEPHLRVTARNSDQLMFEFTGREVRWITIMHYDNGNIIYKLDNHERSGK